MSKVAFRLIERREISTSRAETHIAHSPTVRSANDRYPRVRLSKLVWIALILSAPSLPVLS